MNRVVVTGLGALSACGVGAGALWAAARDGRDGMRPVEFPRIHRQNVRTAGRIADGDVEAARRQRKPRLQDRVAIYALTAAREAVEQAGLGAGDFGTRCAVVVGSGFGGAETLDTNYFRFAEDPTGRVDPFSIPKCMPNSPASWIAMEHGATGPCYCISTACSSAGQSIGLGAQLVRSGAVDLCLAGGAEALLVDGVFRAWEALHVMTPGKCRPFSKDRDGMVLGEGAGIVVLESERAAAARGAPVLAELCGYGTNSDAGDLLRPDAERIADCMRLAIEDAGLEPADIGYINAHGTGTIANDMAETAAMRSLFGSDVDRLCVSSTKPIHGHALGAAGALELIVTIRALIEQVAPPTINFIAVDPKLGIEPVPERARPFTKKAALSNSFAFGGVNASLLVIAP